VKDVGLRSEQRAVDLDQVQHCRCSVLILVLLVVVVMEAGTTTRWPRFQQRGSFAYLGSTLHSHMQSGLKPMTIKAE